MNSLERKRTRKRKLKTLKGKTVLLGVSGGIAACKAVELVRRLNDEGASVIVVMTGAASNFVTPLALEVVSQNKVYTSLFEDPMSHITLPSGADLMIVAPATANIIAKFANGIADDLLSTCFLAYQGKVIIAPAMNWRMYENGFFQENLKRLKGSGAIQVGPEKGSLACGEEGLGRMSEVSDIVDAARAALSKKDLAGEKIVVTAGPTREYIDPVRFISNRSSGKMGYALARAARDRGADVSLISGPSALAQPSGMNFIRVETALEMMDAVNTLIAKDVTALIMAAAVADFSPVRRSAHKVEKTAEFSLSLRATDDIISLVAGKEKRPFILGFAAETGGNIERAAEKMKRKNMDMIVFNDVIEQGSGFDVDTNRVVIIDRKGRTTLDLMHKDSVAGAILDRFVEIKA